MHVREFLDTNVYKIGRTENIQKRINNYPKGSRLLFNVFSHYTISHYTISQETELIHMFSRTFHQRSDIGRENFQGDHKLMMNTILDYVLSFSEPVDLTPPVNDPTPPVIYRQLDPTIVVMEFVDQCREELSVATQATQGTLYRTSTASSISLLTAQQ
jgi:hypothetical protein